MKGYTKKEWVKMIYFAFSLILICGVDNFPMGVNFAIFINLGFASGLISNIKNNQELNDKY